MNDIKPPTHSGNDGDPLFGTLAAWAFMRSLAQSIEAAVYATQEPGSARKQVVFSVQLVRARPFYGFHADERLFIKILL